MKGGWMDAPGTINELIRAAGRALDRPVLTLQDGDLLDRLAEDVRDMMNKPAPDGRLIHDTEYLLAQACAMHARAIAHDGPRAQSLQQVIGVLLPIARRHYGEAMETIRRAPAPDEGRAR